MHRSASHFLHWMRVELLQGLPAQRLLFTIFTRWSILLYLILSISPCELKNGNEVLPVPLEADAYFSKQTCAMASLNSI